MVRLRRDCAVARSARSVDDGGTVSHGRGGNHLLACVLSFSRHDHRTAANNLVIYIVDWRRIIGRIGLHRAPRRVHYRDIRVEKLCRTCLMIEWHFGVAAAAYQVIDVMFGSPSVSSLQMTLAVGEDRQIR